MIKKILLTLTCFIVMSAYADGFITHCTITTYNTGTVTKDGSVINSKDLKKGKIKWVAVSRDLLWKIGMGDIIEIEGLGRYEVHDTTANGLNHTIDILQHPSEKTFKLDKIKVKLIKKAEKDK